MPIRVAIAEDEQIVCDHLAAIVSAQEGFEVIATCGNGDELLGIVQTSAPQIVLLDIEMPGKDGFEVAQELSKQNPDIALIFVTGHTNFSVEAFEVKAFDYVLKPFTEDRVISSLKRVGKIVTALKTKADDDKSRLTIKNGGKTVVIDVNTITFIEKLKDVKRLVFNTDMERHELRQTLEEVLSLLPSQFFRCHKSFIINLDRVEAVRPNGVNSYMAYIDQGKIEIPVGKNHYAEMLERIGAKRDRNAAKAEINKRSLKSSAEAL
ncbi:response regulator [Heliobacterium gestii]|uniref:Stage 0 sporulation protein A homolog n=1 Tax=Heliomicrobium gestii TaxID=2699 RepID=A0A845L706_HELGE|nr:LytTR family DNA-binding domain-containing protein [Heliomicrobium gestii]MBM7865762.1 DNA-binding LytR/AlgR family response regulator [Heliomicrobium gestii]MZP42008.1 response regulator [Heliomicrobium gestii]